MSPIQSLLAGLVDYAGLFPPAGLDMAAVVANHRAYMNGPNSWMLARVVVPLPRLDEFHTEWVKGDGASGARISLLTPPLDDPHFEDAVQFIRNFNVQFAPNCVDAIEVRVSEWESVSHLSELPEGVIAFVEAAANNREQCLQAIANLKQPSRFFAKIRTGGVKPEMIPTADSIGRFMQHCGEAGIGFKATAGLHHPFRSEYPLTYEEGCDVGRMHGFMNVFLGACLLRVHDLTSKELVVVLDEVTPEDIEVTDSAIRWRDYELTAEQIAEARANFLLSFGSCSFTEPVDDLRDLNLLPERS